MSYARRDAAKAARAGLRADRVALRSGTTLAFSEGPASGTPLVLLHGQGSARQSYDRVAPALMKKFHLYTVDVAGHGESDRTPGRYTVQEIGADIADFIAAVVRAPVILSGHSSGGLIAAWVAASAPDLVSGVLFEDAPFFSTEGDRYAKQFNCIDLAQPAHEFLSQNAETDFASWYIAHNAWIGYFGGAGERIIRYARKRRASHPDQPLRLWFLPPVANESYAHMRTFDPAFAEAFFLRTWQDGFDHADALAHIAQPTTLVHANWRITADGVLEGAMTDDDAARACGLLPHAVLERVNSGHGFHFEKPAAFRALIEQLSQRIPGA